MLCLDDLPDGAFFIEENQMARRSDERDAARAEYIARMEKDGEVNLRQLADDLHLKYDTVRPAGRQRTGGARPHPGSPADSRETKTPWATPAAGHLSGMRMQ